MDRQAAREEQLLRMLSAAGTVSTDEAARLLQLSEATVRRLFAAMERSGKVIRSFGGIRPAGSLAGSYSFEETQQAFREEKERIGRLAASFVEEGDTLYLDCGTTLLQMALALSARISAGEITEATIVTNSLANLQALVPPPSGQIILVGGVYNLRRRDFSGTLTERYVAPFHFTRSFFGCDGVDAATGFSSRQIEISSLNSAVLQRTDTAVALLDHSKFGRRTLVSYAQLRDLNAVITDCRPPEPLAGALKEAGVRVHAALP